MRSALTPRAEVATIERVYKQRDKRRKRRPVWTGEVCLDPHGSFAENRLTQHIGIVGVSPEGTALCYREIFRLAQRLGGDRPKPVVTIHNESLDDYLDAVLRDDWHTVGDLLIRSAQVLASAGAEFCIVPDNLMQHGVHLAETRSPVPFLTMTELVTRAVQADKRGCLGLIGTKLVMFGSTYQTTLGMAGVRVLIPESEDADALDAIIFDELLIGVAKPGSLRRVMDVIDGLKERGCDAVVMAVSESPLLVSQENSSLPVYDASMLLALGAVRHAYGLGDGSENLSGEAGGQGGVSNGGNG